MPRKKTKSLIRNIENDRKYGSKLVQKLINKIMLDGKKSIAEQAVYEAMEEAAKKLKSNDPLKSLEQAIDNIRPSVEIRSRRVGGANYQIPFPVQGNRQTHLALMWFVASARARRKGMGKPFSEALAGEIVDAVNETGGSVKKKQDVHAMAEANKAFAHFAKY